MFTQPKDPNNKNKHAYKKHCSYCHRTNHSISACFKKQRDDEDKRDAYARSKSPQKFIDKNSRYFLVPFAVADIKYNIIGTLFFEDNIQNINIQDFTLECKYQSKTHPNYAKFTTLLSKDYPFFSYIYRINSKTQIRLKSKSSKIAHFPMKTYHNLPFTTTPQNHFFPSVPHTYFATKFRTNFNFIEVFTDDKPDICATIIQNTSKHVATLPTGHIGYI